MAEIEVNEYVRTNTGLILKYDDENEKTFIDNFLTCPKIMKERIVKHSKQLIDLVEVGDIVNGMEVLDIHKPRDLWEPIEIRVDSRYTNFILAEDIKTIITKESYMANCYKVGEGKKDEIHNLCHIVATLPRSREQHIMLMHLPFL